jgi:hypothetical protein
MDWRAALAIVKSQQLLLNEVLREVTPAHPTTASAGSTSVFRKRLLSPAVDAFPELRPTIPAASSTLAAHTCVIQAPSTPEPSSSSSSCAECDTLTERSTSVVPDDIVATPRPPAEELSPLVHALAHMPKPATPLACFESVEIFFDSIVGPLSDDDCAETSAIAAAPSYRRPTVYHRFVAEERQARLLIERLADEACLRLFVGMSCDWAAMEVRSAAEFGLLDAYSSESSTLDAYRRRFMHTCAAELEAEVCATHILRR